RTMLLRALSARENLTFYRRFRGLSADGVEAALAAWGISARDRDRPVEQLSAGERRRASLARIRTEPLAIMLLDEPFTELEDDALEGLVALPGGRDALFGGKVVAIAVVLAIVALVGGLLSLVLLDLPLALPLHLVVVVVLGVVALPPVVVVDVVLALRLRAR